MLQSSGIHHKRRHCSASGEIQSDKEEPARLHASNLLSFLEKKAAAVDGGDSEVVVFLDFAKAFDKVPTERLVKKVWAHMGYKARCSTGSKGGLRIGNRVWS